MLKKFENAQSFTEKEREVIISYLWYGYTSLSPWHADPRRSD